MQYGQWDPQDGEREAADEAAKGVGEDHAPARADALRGTGVSFIQDFVQTIQHATDSDDDIPQQSILRLVVGRTHRAVGRLFALGVTSVGDDEHTHDGHPHRENLVGAKLVVEQGNGERVGEEGGAIVDGCQIAGGGHVHGHVPRPTGDGESAGDKHRHLEQVGNRGPARRRMNILRLHHLPRCAQ